MLTCKSPPSSRGWRPPHLTGDYPATAQSIARHAGLTHCSIVEAVKLGRRIYDNIKKAIVFIVAVHVPIAGLSMLPVFFA